MGTNFYTEKGKHIGKRSAAGRYCWDCKVTLCKQGESFVHRDAEWFDKCPKCGKSTKAKKGLSTSSAGRELGFNKGEFKEKTGVCSCSSFSWAIYPYKLKGESVVDEYYSEYTIEEFQQILKECPIEIFHSIGVDFS